MKESAQKFLELFVDYEKIALPEDVDARFDLGRVKQFLHESGVDFESLKYLHVAGSKGKGSVSALLAGYLKENGNKVGLYTSPHILDVCERITVGGEIISDDNFVALVDWVKSCDPGKFALTYFELLTVMALKYFVDCAVDYAVLEVGLGGRLDATNIVNPVLTVLTSVELEHLGVLGDNLSEILDEKLGIVKEGVPLVVGVQGAEARLLIEEKMGEKEDVYFVEGETGSARADNGRLAFMALRVLFDDVDHGAFDRAADGLKLPGRFDLREIDGKKVVFDMAHTVSSVRNLLHGLDAIGNAAHEAGSEAKFVFLIGMLKGKDVNGVLDLIKPEAERIVFSSCHRERGYSGEELAEIYSGKAEVLEDSVKAFDGLLKDLKKNQVLVVTGSHFLLGDVLKHLTQGA